MNHINERQRAARIFKKMYQKQRLVYPKCKVHDFYLRCSSMVLSLFMVDSIIGEIRRTSADQARINYWLTVKSYILNIPLKEPDVFVGTETDGFFTHEGYYCNVENKWIKW